MIDKDTEQKILAEYDANAHTYTILAPKLEQLIRDILHERGIQVHTISSRAKSRKSLAGKLAKNNAEYENLADLTDLIGLRITTFFAEDVDRVATVITEEFDIDPENSVDKRQALAPDRFGYLSLHHVLSMKDSRCEFTEYRAFKGLKLELQTRSILQHAWAEIEHDLGYKSEIEVPQHIRRRFALVAGLLELADREFDGIKEELESYRIGVASAVQNKPEEVSLDLDSMRALLEGESIVVFIDRNIEELTGRENIGYYDAAVPIYLERMQQMGFKSIGDITEALLTQKSLILSFAKYWEATRIERTDGLTGVGASLYYLWLLWLSNKPEDVAGQILVQGEHARPKTSVKRLFSASNKARLDIGV